jgi:monoamine oxidase
MTEVDVIVIGAGAAGLSAASAMVNEGLRVTLLEARGRLGGRILTVRDPASPVPLELGAEFVHGQAVRTRELLASAGAHAVDVDAESWQARGGSIQRANTWEAMGRVLGGLDADRSPDRSFADYLREVSHELEPEAKAAATSFVEGFFAADARRISERALASTGGPETAAHSARIPEGYDTLVRALAEGLDVLTDHSVTRVEWRHGDVRVHGERTADRAPFGPLHAPAAVITLPLGVLAAPEDGAGRPHIERFPARWSEAMKGVAMGEALRVLLAFDRPVAELIGDGGSEPFDGFLYVMHRNPPVFWTLSPVTDRVLVAWAGGPRVRELPHDRDALVERALGVVADEAGVTRAALNDALTGTFWHDWSRDPWTRGAYAYPVVGGDGATEALAEPVEGTLFLAGEATSEEEMGTVEGALSSGVRAARSVIDSLGRAGA